MARKTNNRFKHSATDEIGSVGRSSEKRLSKKLSARLTPASGAVVGAKGDMVTSNFLIEAKSTVKKSISIKLDWLTKITKEALQTSKTPAVTISFTDASGRAVHGGDWVMIPLADFEELREGLNNVNDKTP